MWRRNWLWVILAIILFASCYLLTVGLDKIGLMNPTRIVLLGNFFNVPNIYFFFTYLPLAFFLIFLLKVILDRLKNRNSNIILIFSNAFLILHLTYLTLKINWINENNILDDNTLKLWSNILHISLPIQFFLISVLVIVSWEGEKISRRIK